MERKITLEQSWLNHLEAEFSKPYMIQLREFLRAEISAGKQIFPHGSEYFAAFDAVPYEAVRVVIVGQDPYHGDGQAHGLSFSVRPGVAIPPSLLNIYKELEIDLGFKAPKHGFLKPWAEQGVLLLNSVLTVERGLAGSHQNRGWERFTDEVMDVLNRREHALVFLLWGSYAQKKGLRIDREKHLVLQAPHPSPLSAYRGFFGCRHFSKANDFLVANGAKAIDWSRLAQDSRELCSVPLPLSSSSSRVSL
jgi:uracil-DNA glycosylase